MMTTSLKTILARFHAEQSGAIALLLMAACLILFMIAMVLYDTGQSARDKMDVQIAADHGAFSHSVVKARTMNMVAYSNTIKRMIYAYANVYATGWAALLAQFAIDKALCFKPFFPDPSACVRWGKGLVMIIAEGIEAGFTNIRQMIPGGSRAKTEIAALDKYQKYMIGITPWWAYVENMGRAMGAGAMSSAAWPPPTGNLTWLADTITQVAGFLDGFVGTSFMALIPAHTNSTDALPLKRRDADEGAVVGHISYCAEYVLSFEQLVLSLQYMAQTEKIGGMKLIFVGLSIVPAIGCTVAGLIYGGDVLDYKITDSRSGLGVYWAALGGGGSTTDNKWLQNSGSITLAYKPRSGRNSDTEGRKRLRFVKQDYGGIGQTIIYKNEGYFALARSEMMYKDVSITGAITSAISGSASSGSGGLTGFASRVTARPNMWSPAWTARLRPITLPGETFGETTHGGNTGMGAMFFDMAPFLIVSAALGLFNDDFGGQSAINDLLYLHRATSGFTHDKMEGIAK
ncbi:MAG: hypothetical protein H0U74_03170 [Bradymonadaceae bacterium]|nr:hypothetical protein [Lujinxingiaceae bacterium]